MFATRFEQRWASDNDHPEIEFVEARPGSERTARDPAAHEASEARAVARAVLDALARGAALDRIAIVPVDAADAFLEPLRAELAAARLPFSEAWGQAHELRARGARRARADPPGARPRCCATRWSTCCASRISSLSALLG